MKKSLTYNMILISSILCLTFFLGMTCFLKKGREVTVFRLVSPRNAVTLILDPGHGGADGGAVSVTGSSESVINLEVAMRVRELAAFYGISPVMTRESEDISYPESAATIRAKKVWDTKNRESLVKSQENAVFLSIHQNKYTTAGPHGVQIFFAPTEGSQELAERVKNAFSQAIPDNSTRNVTKIGENVYLMNHLNCPGVLVECGFVSNPSEAHLLEDPEYQLKLAVAIAGGYLGENS